MHFARGIRQGDPSKQARAGLPSIRNLGVSENNENTNHTGNNQKTTNNSYDNQN